MQIPHSLWVTKTTVLMTWLHSRTLFLCIAFFAVLVNISESNVEKRTEYIRQSKGYTKLWNKTGIPVLFKNSRRLLVATIAQHSSKGSDQCKTCRREKKKCTNIGQEDVKKVIICRWLQINTWKNQKYQLKTIRINKTDHENWQLQNKYIIVEHYP